MYDLVLVVVSINNENMATETETLPNGYVEAQTWPWHVMGGVE